MTRALRAAVVALPLTFFGCGYALVGHNVTVDPSIKKIGVPMFKNRTGRAELDQKVTQDVIDELVKRKRFEIVRDTNGVDAIVEGEIVSYTARPAGFSGTGTAATEATQYHVTLTAKVRYVKVGQDEPIWSDDAFTKFEDYDVGSDPSTFFDREGQAIDRLTSTLARGVVASMLEAF